MESLYDEQLICDSGLNVRISKGLYFCDILRTEFKEELSQTLAIIYMQHLANNSKYQVFQGLISPLPEFCICLLSDWSVFIKSKVCYRSLMLSPVSSLQKPHQNTMSLIINSSNLTTYKVIGLISLYLSIKNPIIFIELFKKTNFSELAVKTLHQVQNFLYVSSKLPYKTLQLNIIEAKELLRSRKIFKSKLAACVKPIVSIESAQVKNMKRILTDLYEIRENSESMEYSPTQEISSRRNSKS
jgi:hypothetical protein